MTSKPTIGITLGDPAGIGPEVTAKALRQISVRNTARFKIFSDRCVFDRYFPENSDKIECIDSAGLPDAHWTIGQVNKKTGQAALKSIDVAVAALKTKEISALVTAPVNKKAVSLVDKHFQGHTEYLGDAFGVKNVGMMFVAKGMRTIIVTRHVPMAKIPQSLTSRNIFETIKLSHEALRRFFHIRSPRIGVCGLNPHAGEGGTIGKEELTKIIPAIRQAQKKGMNVVGPLAGDTIFTPKNSRHFDVIVAMYHDQGLIPIKTLYFTQLVNLTIGLPFVRTSPAHGTAFDIAEKNKADPSSMIEAIRLAVKLAA